MCSLFHSCSGCVYFTMCPANLQKNLINWCTISPMQVFLVIRKSLKRCSALTKNQTLFNLFQVGSFPIYVHFLVCCVRATMFAFRFFPRCWYRKEIGTPCIKYQMEWILIKYEYTHKYLRS